MTRAERRKIQAEIAKLRAETAKLKTERSKLDREAIKIGRDIAVHWRFFQAIGFLAPGLTVFIAVLSLLHIYHQAHADSFRAVLKDVGGDKAHTRMAAAASLATYEVRSTLFWRSMDYVAGTPSAADRRLQIIRSVADALRIEDDVHVKHVMMRLLEGLGPQAVAPLRRIRLDLIVLLKQEDGSRPSEYWNNLRQTLLGVGVTLAALESTPPDFRCFPLKGIHLRLRVLVGARFDGATLFKAEIWGGSFRGASFRDANLTGAVVRDVDVAGASFEGADLRDASFGPNLVDVDPAKFRGSNWERVKRFDPLDLGNGLVTTLGAGTGETVTGTDRDVLCAKLLNTDFLVR